MNTDEAHDAVVRALHSVAPELDVSDLEPGDDLQEIGGLDSMDFLNLMIALHDLTGVDVPERDYPQLTTIDRATGYVAAHA